MAASSGGASVTGVRDENQDAIGLWPDLGIYAVADGMGGMNDGAAASRTAIGSLQRAGNNLARYARSLDPVDHRRLVLALEQLFKDANKSLQRSRAESTGTTLSAVVLAGGHALIAHIGDTRVYRIRGNRVELLTDDHSLAALRYRGGKISVEEYQQSPLKSVLYEYLGNDAEVTVDMVQVDLAEGDRLLLCSDGVWEHLGNGDLLAIATADDPEEGARHGVNKALQRGSSDNCSLVVVQIEDSGLPVEDLLPNSNLFQGLDPAQVRMLSPYLALQDFWPGEAIIEEGEDGEALYLVARGEVEVSANGRSLVRLGQGTNFGELALACKTQRSATVKAVTEVTCILLDREGLNLLCKKRPDLGNRVLKRLLRWVGTRLIDLTRKISD